MNGGGALEYSNRAIAIAFTALLTLLFAVFSAPAVYPAGQYDTRSEELTDSDATGNDRREEREALVETGVAGMGVSDPATIRAMRAVPRHRFVPREYRQRAYENRPLPIGLGQTISQPYIVGFMTEALELAPDHRVLEIGTGSGYQAAVLAEIVEHVYTIEIVAELAVSARERLERLGYENVTVRQGDGYFGWAEEAPFDAIIVTAAAGHIPRPLLDQLKPTGRLIIPVGPVFDVQTLVLARLGPSGEVRTEHLLPVRFVPMTGQAED